MRRTDSAGLRMIAVTLAALAQTASGQVTASARVVQQQPEPVYSIKSKAQYVLVPVVVTDKKSRFRPGLPKDAFKVFENGKPVKVSSLEEVQALALPVARVEPADGDFNNHLATDARHPRLVILALDLINTPFFDEARARDAIFEYFSQSVDGTALIQLVAIGSSGVRVIHDFTDDPKVLIAALAQVSRGKGGPGQQRATAMVDPMAARRVEAESSELNALDKMVERGRSFQARVDTQDTLIALQHIAQASAGLAGRKSLIWLTAGFPFPYLTEGGFRSSEVPVSMFERTMEMLSNANVAVYPVNAKGLFDPGFRDASQMSYGNPAADRARYSSVIATMTEFASATGGKAYLYRNDMDRSVREAAQDSSSYYLLSYPLDQSNKKFGWRKLKVEVKAEGVRVRARSGYYFTEGTFDPAQTRQVDMTNALNSPVNYTALPLSMRWREQKPVAGKSRVMFEVRVPAGVVNVDESAGNRLSFDVAMKVRNEKEAEAAKFWQEISIQPKAQSLERIRRDGLMYRNAVDVPTGSYRVRLVFRDNLSGKIGSVSVPLQVP